jgi:hypothetical protein
MVLVLCLRTILPLISLRATTDLQESSSTMSKTRFLTMPTPRVKLEAAAVRSVLLPRPGGVATTAVVKTIGIQKLGRELS